MNNADIESESNEVDADNLNTHGDTETSVINDDSNAVSVKANESSAAKKSRKSIVYNVIIGLLFVGSLSGYLIPIIVAQVNGWGFGFQQYPDIVGYLWEAAVIVAPVMLVLIIHQLLKLFSGRNVYTGVMSALIALLYPLFIYFDNLQANLPFGSIMVSDSVKVFYTSLFVSFALVTLFVGIRSLSGKWSVRHYNFVPFILIVVVLLVIVVFQGGSVLLGCPQPDGWISEPNYEWAVWQDGPLHHTCHMI